MKAFIQKSSSLEETKQFASTIGKKLRGGEVFELISDLGGGKTSFVSGLAAGFGSVDPEWGDIVHNVLPDDRIRVSIATVGENARIISFKYSGAYDYLFENAMSFKEYRKK